MKILFFLLILTSCVYATPHTCNPYPSDMMCWATKPVCIWKSTTIDSLAHVTAWVNVNKIKDWKVVKFYQNIPPTVPPNWYIDISYLDPLTPCTFTKICVDENGECT